MGRTFGTLKDFWGRKESDMTEWLNWTERLLRKSDSRKNEDERMKNEITSERRKRKIQSENNTQLWRAMEIKSDAVKNNIAQEPKC